MRILIVGNGGREHALLWKLRRDAPSAEFYATTPNGGMAPGCEAVEIAPGDVEALSGWAAAHRIDLTVVGPEGPLAAGIVDRFEDKGLPIFGPSKNGERETRNGNRIMGKSCRETGPRCSGLRETGS